MADRPLSDLLRHLRRVALPPAGVLPDEELLRRFATSHDEAAFEALVWRHAPLVLGVCRRVLGPTPDAEDAFQATFFVLARKAGSIHRGTAVGPWLYRVAHRAALRARGHMARTGRVEPLPADLASPASPDGIERHDLKCILDEEVQRLPAKYREPVILRYLEGLSTVEVARTLGCPPGTVFSRLAWARQRLRTRLAARGVTLSAAVAAAVATGREAGAVPVRWVAATVGAALRFAASEHSHLSLTGPVLLAEGVLRAMWMTKLRVGAVLALGVLVTGAGLMLPGQSAVLSNDPPTIPALAAAPAPAPAPDDQPGVVTVSKPVQRELAIPDDFTGGIEASVSVDVRPRVTGLLEKVAFRPGAMVKPGDLLFELDSRSYRVEVDKAQAELQRAEARLRRAETDLARIRALQRSNAVAQDEVDRIAGDREEAMAGVRIAQTVVERTRLDLESTRISAPIAGRIGRALLDAGNVVNPTMVLATLVSTDVVFATFTVDERTFLRLRKLIQKAGNEPAIVALMGVADEEGFPRRGHVEFVDNHIDPRTGTVRVRAAFPNRDGELIPGMTARVRVVTEEPRLMLLVPEKIVTTTEGQPSVPVLIGTDRVESRIVTLGPVGGDLRVIRSGLKADDRVIIDGLANVKPGVQVQVRDLDVKK
jgi:multidrug efflux system membrane fusion protein